MEAMGSSCNKKSWLTLLQHRQPRLHLCYLVKIPTTNHEEEEKRKKSLPHLVAYSMHQPHDHQQQQIITRNMNHHHHHNKETSPMVFVIMGVSGSGKTTVGELLAKTMEFGFLDADDFHPPSNIDKMTKGIPLNEEDRIPWLETLRDTLRTKIHQISYGEDSDEDKKRKAVLCCSALQKKYREILRTADPNYKPGSYVPGRVKFIYLETPMEVLLNRVNKRAEQGKHFMPASLLQSQLDLLQIDDSQEKDIAVVDGTLPPQLIVNDVRSHIL